MNEGLFATEEQLFRYEPGLRDFLPEDQPDWTQQLIAAKDEIVEELIRDNILDTTDPAGHENAENQILRPEELNLASIWKALQIIFFSLSHSGADKFADKSSAYEKKYTDEMVRVKGALSIDRDGDLSEDSNEIQRNFNITLKRT